jgi:hypothetical protein
MSRNDKQQQHAIDRTRFHPCLPPRSHPDDSDSRAKTKLQVASDLDRYTIRFVDRGPRNENLEDDTGGVTMSSVFQSTIRTLLSRPGLNPASAHPQLSDSPNRSRVYARLIYFSAL